MFYSHGVKVQMGHLGNWLEVRRWRPKHADDDNENPYRLTLNNGLSTGSYFFQGNKLVVTHEPSVAAQS